MRLEGRAPIVHGRDDSCGNPASGRLRRDPGRRELGGRHDDGRRNRFAAGPARALVSVRNARADRHAAEPNAMRPLRAPNLEGLDPGQRLDLVVRRQGAIWTGRQTESGFRPGPEADLAQSLRPYRRGHTYSRQPGGHHRSCQLAEPGPSPSGHAGPGRFGQQRLVGRAGLVYTRESVRRWAPPRAVWRDRKSAMAGANWRLSPVEPCWVS